MFLHIFLIEMLLSCQVQPNKFDYNSRNSWIFLGYFVVNEILKSYPENKTWPHWSLVDLVSDFLNSFRPAAAMVSCSNKWKLVPVVEQLGRAHVVSTWKLDSTSLKFFLKGTMTYERILPYSKYLTAPQPHLVKHLLSQPYRLVKWWTQDFLDIYF